MKCKMVRNRLDALLDGELPVAEVERMKAHLGECQGCRQELAARQQIADALSRLPPILAPNHFARRARRAFRSNLKRPGMAEWWQGLSMAMRSAVCGAALAGLLCGAVLGINVTASQVPGTGNLYQNFYASKGIYP
ncbi:zf-HC2 domain-containing protein [uncultured Desulfosarcina sp.]|uniref:anti-sigma factor family protein n=1 Tax=uncultured Desulfosarcina sp. TaxID=218289 RepID=UPI0029C6A47B|nr:zf-HC2 domain-containing protein [uncultured Desulfosarcina sp.]